MSFNEILEQLPRLTEDEKRQLWHILDQQLADEGEESPEFLAEPTDVFGFWIKVHGPILLMRPAKW
jgi:hypothetical protein